MSRYHSNDFNNVWIDPVVYGAKDDSPKAIRDALRRSKRSRNASEVAILAAFVVLATLILWIGLKVIPWLTFSTIGTGTAGPPRIGSCLTLNGTSAMCATLGQTRSKHSSGTGRMNENDAARGRSRLRRISQGEMYERV